MKREYTKPLVEKIDFDYEDQVVVASDELGLHTVRNSGSDCNKNCKT